MYDELLDDENKNKDKESGSKTPSSSKKTKKDKKKKKGQEGQQGRQGEVRREGQGQAKIRQKPEKTPEKSRRPMSDDEGSDAPKASKPKKVLRTVAQCCRDKWAWDYDRVTDYRQRVNISIHTLAEGRHYDDHTNYIRQLMAEPAYRVERDEY